MPRYELRDYERAYPWIKWRQPVIVNGRYGCRVCIGQVGIKGNETSMLPKSRKKWEQHFRIHHGEPE